MNIDELVKEKIGRQAKELCFYTALFTRDYVIIYGEMQKETNKEKIFKIRDLCQFYVSYKFLTRGYIEGRWIGKKYLNDD